MRFIEAFWTVCKSYLLICNCFLRLLACSQLSVARLTMGLHLRASDNSLLLDLAAELNSNVETQLFAHFYPII